MKSFHLHIESKSELVQSAIGLLIGAAVFLALRHFDIAGTGYRVVMLLLAAVMAGYLWRTQLCRTLRRRYPNARWIPLLAVGLTIAGFGAIARFVLPQADEGWFTLAFLLPSGACIAAYIIINRRPGCYQVEMDSSDVGTYSCSSYGEIFAAVPNVTIPPPSLRDGDIRPIGPRWETERTSNIEC